MPLASLTDVNVHLPDDKAEVDSARYADYQLDAERIIRGYLAGRIDAAVLATWATPATTPDIIRACAGRFVAAFQYRKLYSEDSLDDPQYAQFKYNEAMAIINGIINGTIILVDTPVVGGDHMAEGDFYPDETAAGPYFKMGVYP